MIVRDKSFVFFHRPELPTFGRSRDEFISCFHPCDGISIITDIATSRARTSIVGHGAKPVSGFVPCRRDFSGWTTYLGSVRRQVTLVRSNLDQHDPIGRLDTPVLGRLYHCRPWLILFTSTPSDFLASFQSAFRPHVTSLKSLSYS